MSQELFKNKVVKPNEEAIPMPDYHMYVCEKSPNFKLRLIDGPPEDVYAQFENGSFKTTNEKYAALLDKFIATMPNISALVRKVDWTEAAKAVRKAKKEYAEKNTVVKGSVTSQTFTVGRETHVDDIRARMIAEGVTEDKIDEVIKGIADAGIPIVVETDAAEILAKEVTKDSQIVSQPTMAAPKKLNFASQAKVN